MQILPYSSGNWDADRLGNHRVVIRVGQPESPAVRVTIPWRRRDHRPQEKALILVSQVSGRRVTELFCRLFSRESLDLVFQPLDGPGDYFLYYMPYTGTVQAPYPQITYLPPEETASTAWLETYGRLGEDAFSRLPVAEALEIQSIDELSSFSPMEVIASAAETAALLAQHPEKSFFLFPEERAYPIRMPEDLPQRWIAPGPSRLFQATAERGEFFTFQAGVFAARASLQQVQVAFSGLRGLEGQPAIPPQAFTCWNLGGTDWTGLAFEKEITIPRGQIQALWCGIQVPEEAAPGLYSAEVTVSAPCAGTEQFTLHLQVSQQLLPAHGDDHPERLSRLRWLDSTIALDDEVTAPFTPIQVSAHCFEILGRSVEIGPDGFPARIRSFFSPEVTGLAETGQEILSAPLAFSVLAPSGQAQPWEWEQPARLSHQSPGRVAWNAHARAGRLRLDLQAALEFDGTLEYTLALRAEERVELRDTRLDVPLRQAAARYMLGLGFRGGLRPASYDWTWDVAAKNQDSLWLGAVNAGLQVTLKDERYVRPLNTNFYTLKPLVSPISWDNAGRGSIRFSEGQDQTLLLRCSGGPRVMAAGQVLHFNFRLAITPFKPINPGAQWATRFYHRFSPLEEVQAGGANTINVHHANAINPFINYPFLRPAEMKAYIDEAHTRGLKVKIYYTVRELTNHAPELFALRSLGDEILSDGPGGGHSWLQEHLVSNYVTGWHVYELKDVAVVNSGTSRWHNFYLEGLDWLARNIGIDGLYIDDLAFDRVVMKRVRKILERRRPGALIDLHSANQFRERDGFANSANLYMEHFPYLDRMWFGEYFDYNLAPDFWLVEVSGIPFGLMGEMLQDGGNPWRGMIYGMTGRYPWAGNPGAMWRAWDELRIQESRMIGYWSPNCPVRTDQPDVLATVYQKESSALISLASWASETVQVRLQIDWAALGLDAARARLSAPEIPDFQEAASFSPTDAIPIEPGKGWFLELK